ncbi:uncharacterized protein LOC109714875 [Ananas comosus]|uniref:Uncharacterized protein LOC109714875 n=1 Tax=Ananas comosus TaxID=4615 RepID=A0A6P5FP03_ANACO|nr:uncharacterized protein LOC109714875 [Ananas comosus]
MSSQEQKELLPTSLLCINHVAYLCSSVEKSLKFYQEVLGFELIERPPSLDFKGAWIHQNGIGIHLLQRSTDVDAPAKPSVIDPTSNHISFQCGNIWISKKKLEDMGVEYVSLAVGDEGVVSDQLYFHDPDRNAVELCDCRKRFLKNRIK